MKLNKLIIKNFMAIKDSEFDFDNHGLTQIVGVNNDSPTSKSSGAGKSNLYESIYYAITGNTLRKGGKADDVINNKVKKDTKVELHFRLKKDNVVVTRYRKDEQYGNELHISINDKPHTKGTNQDTQKFIYQVLGFNETTFRKMLFFTTDDLKPFTEMTDKELKELFEEILNFEEISVMQDKAKEKVKALNEELSDVEKTAEQLISQVSFKQEELDKEKVYAEQFKEVMKEKVKERKDKVKANLKSIDSLEKLDLSSHKKALKQKKDRLNNMSTTSYNADKHNTIKVDIQMGKQSAHRLLKDVEQLKRDQTVVSSTVGQKCKSCGSLLTKEHISPQTVNIQAKIKQKEGEAKDIVDGLQVLNNLSMKLDKEKVQYDMVKAQLDEVRIEIFDMESNINKAETHNSLVDTQIAQLNSENEMCERDIEQLKSAKNKHLETVEEIEAHIGKLHEKIATCEKGIESKLKEIDIHEKLVVVFGNSGLKGDILMQVTPILNAKIKEYVNQLDDIDVVFNTVTRLKNGDLRNKFSVDVINRSGATAYHMNSTGERQKINIAVALAFTSFLKDYIGMSSNALFLDEFLDGLDESASVSVVELIKNVTSDIDNVFLISHKEAVKNEIVNSIEVVKENGYSEIRR